MEPEPERLGEPAEKVNMVNIEEELGKPVVERLVSLAHVLREHWDDGHLSNLLYYPGNGLLPKYTSKRTCFQKTLFGNHTYLAKPVLALHISLYMLSPIWAS